MRKSIATAFALCGFCTSSLWADFTYTSSTKFTGGAMAGVMKMAGVFSKQAREGMNSTVLVKGDRMATIAGNHINIIDVAKETLTDIDLGNKTYSTITFADMSRAMTAAAQKANKKNESADFTFRVDVKNTGASRVVSGFDAKEVILTIHMDGVDKKSGEKFTMSMASDMWVTPKIQGYDEVRNLQMKMAQLFAGATGMQGMMAALSAQQPGLDKAMAESAKEMAKIQGVPVLMVMRMQGNAANMPSEAEMSKAQRDAEAAQAQQQRQDTPTSASEAAASAIAGRLGRLGGFGRKKKEEPAQTEQAQTASNSTPAPSSPTPPGTLMEITTEFGGFSSGAVDSAKFEIPAGFKQIEHPMQKSLR